MAQKYSGVLDTGSVETGTLLRFVAGHYVYLPQANDGNSTAQGNEWIGMLANESDADCRWKRRRNLPNR